MLAAVMTEAPSTEGLRGYLLSGGRRPTDVRAFDQSGVRQPMAMPNGAVPGAQNPIPTSSARPSKATNARIVYSRVQTAFAKSGGAIDITPVREGDAVFVHRQDGMTSVGHDTNKTSRVATLQQLNNVLGSYSGVPDEVGDIVMPITDKDGNVLNPAGLGKDDYVAERGAVGVPADNARAEWERGVVDRVAHRWKHCRWLAQWTPDGVLASNEHDCVLDNSNPGEVYNIAIGGPTLMRNAAAGDYPQHWDDGVRTLDKVFIGLIATEKRGTKGRATYWTYRYKLFSSRQLVWAQLARPTVQTTRSGAPLCTKWKRVSREEASLGDALPLVPGLRKALQAGQRTFNVAEFDRLDAPGLTADGLKAQDWVKTGDLTRPDDGEYFIPDAMPPEARVNAAHAGGDNTLGPTQDEFRRMVQVWRIGSVLDTRAGMLPYKCVTLNVVVEEWDLDQVAAEFNDLFGRSATLMKLNAETAADDAAAITEAADLAARGIQEDVQRVYLKITGLGASASQISGVEAEVEAWNTVYGQYTDARSRGAVMTPPVVESGIPVPMKVPAGQEHLVERNTRTWSGPHQLVDPLYYVPPSTLAQQLLAVWSNDISQAVREIFDVTPGSPSAQRWALIGRATALGGRTAATVGVHDQFMVVRRDVAMARKVDAAQALGWRP